MTKETGQWRAALWPSGRNVNFLSIDNESLKERKENVPKRTASHQWAIRLKWEAASAIDQVCYLFSFTIFSNFLQMSYLA